MVKQIIADYVKAVIDKESAELAYISNVLDYQKVAELCNMIIKSKGNIILTGCGTSAMAAKKIVHTLNVIDQKAFYLNPSDAVHGELGVISGDDVVIFISKGGNTKELTAFLKNIIQKKAKIVAVTENEKSKIAVNSNLLIKVKVTSEADQFNMLATSSTLSVISLFDGIAVALINQENFNKTEFLDNHPSGDVGERLKMDQKNSL